MYATLRRWSLLPFATILLSIHPTLTKVVTSMADCPGFLLLEKPPNVPDVLQDGTILDQNRYKVICQTFKNKRRYVTLYDTRNKIPVFSAFKYRGEEKTEGKETRPPWKIEPELEPTANPINMRNDANQNQASNFDYCSSEKKYNRGHLFPMSYGFDANDRDSTFTLTNIVPQVETFNGGSWEKMEKCVKCILNEHCISNNNLPEGFVVTGAMPGNTQLKKRVNIPSLLWSAFCCYNHKMEKWVAAAHWGDNVPEERKSKTTLEQNTLAELHEQLGFEVFPGTKCPLYETGLQEGKSRRSRRSISASSTSSSFCQCLPQTSTISASPTTTTSFPSSTVSTTLSTTLSTTTDKTTTFPTTTTTTTTTTATTTTTTTTSTTTKKKKDNPDDNKGGGDGGEGGALRGGFGIGALGIGALGGGALGDGGGGGGGGNLHTTVPATSQNATTSGHVATTTRIPLTAAIPSVATNPTTTETPTGTTSQTRTNSTSTTSTQTIPAASEPQTNSTTTTSTPTIPATSEPQTNTTNRTPTALIHNISEHQTKSSATSLTSCLICSYIFCILFCCYLIYS